MATTLAHAYQMFRIQLTACDIKVTWKGYRSGALCNSGFAFWNGTTWDTKFYLSMFNEETSFFLSKQEVIDGMDMGGYIYFLAYVHGLQNRTTSAIYSDFFSVEPAPMSEYGTPAYVDTTGYLLGHTTPEAGSPQVEGEYTVVTNENSGDFTYIGYWFYGGEAYVTTGPAGGNYIFRVFVRYRIGFKSTAYMCVSSPPVAVGGLFTGLIRTNFPAVQIPNPGYIVLGVYAGLYLDNPSAYIECDNGGFNQYNIFTGNMVNWSGYWVGSNNGDMMFKCLVSATSPMEYGTVAWDV